MKKIFFILVCCSLAFSQEHFKINVFYNDPQNAQCNSFQKHISSFLDNPYLKSQNIYFETTQIKQPLNAEIKRYKLQGKCDLVISYIKQNQEVAYKTFDLSLIIPRYDFFFNFLTDESELYDGLSPYKFLAWVWEFVLQHSQKFHTLTLIFALCYGIASGAVCLRFARTPHLFTTISLLAFSLLLGGLLTLILGKTIYPTKLPYYALEALHYLLAIFTLIFFFFSISDNLDSLLAFFTASMFCSIFVASILSIHSSLEIIGVYSASFLLSIFILSKLKSDLITKGILVIASVLFLSMAIFMIWIFGYICRTYALYLTVCMIGCYGYIPYRKYKTNFSKKSRFDIFKKNC